MLTIQKGVIYITHGDTASINVQITKIDGSEYELQDGETLTFTVKRNTEFDSRSLIQIVSREKVINITPQDTKVLPNGKYTCDIQLTTNAGDIFTIFPEHKEKYTVDGNWGNFVITPEVTE